MLHNRGSSQTFLKYILVSLVRKENCNIDYTRNFILSGTCSDFNPSDRLISTKDQISITSERSQLDLSCVVAIDVMSKVWPPCCTFINHHNLSYLFGCFLD